jgi:uncharacterized protein YbjT (DUF2867 family)
MNMMKVAIAGASGLIGKIVTEKLISQKHHHVLTLTRRLFLPPASHEKLYQNLVMDWDHWQAQDLNAQIFICCLGTTIKKAGSQANFRKVDFEYVQKFAEAAKKSHAQKFILVSALGANEQSNIFYNKIKGETENMLMSFQFNSLAILRPSLLLGEREENRPGEKLAQKLSPIFNLLLRGPLEKYQAISADEVATVITKLVDQTWQGLKILESDQIKKFSVI